MRCYQCGAQLTEKDFCGNCGADVSRYKKLLSFANYCYNDGLSRAQVRDLSGAILSLQQCLNYNKYHIAARNLLGLVYYEMGETVAALSEWVISKNLRPEKNVADDYIDSIQKSPAQIEAVNQRSRKFNLALSYCYQDSKDLAVIQLKKILSDSPNFVQGHLLLALLYLDAGDWEKANREVKRCLRIDRANTTALRYLDEVERAQQAETEGHVSKRQNKTEDVIKYQSGNETIIQPVGVTEQKRGIGWLWGLCIGLAAGLAAAWFLILPSRVQSAQEALNAKLVEIGQEIDNRNAQISSLTQQVDSLNRTNAELKQKADALAGVDGQMSVAEALLNAVYLYLDAPDDADALSEAIEKIDENALQQADVSETVRSLYDKLLKAAGPDLAKSFYDTGYSAYQSQDYDTAIENLSKAVAYDPDNEEALFALGNSYREKGNDSLAIETYEKLLQLFPDTQKAKQSQGYLDDLRQS